jgi:predicted lipoprotein with Yx(FWY)xxD motif
MAWYWEQKSHLRPDEETNNMEHIDRAHQAPRRIRDRRIATATFVAAGLSASVLTAGIAGASTGAGVVISTTKNAKLGTVLVSGNALYTLKASKTACTAQCLKVWPAVLLPKGATSATAGKGVSEAKLGTVKRSGGKLQVTYAGKPLYWFSGDSAAGQVNGNMTDKWGKWSSVTTAKSGQTGSGSTPTTSPSSGGASF